ncbi:MAG: hypothetical protein V5A31_05210 [Haloferacaceae archaeon]|jgi:butyrate kinase
MADGLFAAIDPESVADERPTGLVTTPRAVFAFHLVIAIALVGLAATLVGQSSLTGTVVVAAMGGMVAVAGWAAGRIVARR